MRYSDVIQWPHAYVWLYWLYVVRPIQMYVLSVVTCIDTDHLRLIREIGEISVRTVLHKNNAKVLSEKFSQGCSDLAKI